MHFQPRGCRRGTVEKKTARARPRTDEAPEVVVAPRRRGAGEALAASRAPSNSTDGEAPGAGEALARRARERHRCTLPGPRQRPAR